MDLIIHWNDFFAVIAVVTGIVTAILAIRYGALDGENDYDAKSARKLIMGFFVVATITAALAVSIV